MGCGNSKVLPSTENVKVKVDQRSDSAVSGDLSETKTDNREGSASSKFSTNSGDSGLGGEEINRTNAALLRNQSWQQHSKKPEKSGHDILEQLRNEGIITKSVGGLSFSVDFSGAGKTELAPLRTPARLEKMQSSEKGSKRRKRRSLQKLKEKQMAVEKSAQNNEQLDSSSTNTSKPKIIEPVQNERLPSSAEDSPDETQDLQTDLDYHAKLREQRIKALRERLRARDEHAKRVRMRKREITTIIEESTDISERSSLASTLRRDENTPIKPSSPAIYSQALPNIE